MTEQQVEIEGQDSRAGLVNGSRAVGRGSSTPSNQALGFKSAMAAFPSGVTIVTTIDANGVPRGFTATAFTSVSADPPLVLSCLAKSAQCYEAFSTADRWLVHVVADDQADLAMKFASRGAEKFADLPIEWLESGMPSLPGVVTVLECSTFAKHDGGDHIILIGEVDAAVETPASPAVYYRRSFHSLLDEPVGAIA